MPSHDITITFRVTVPDAPASPPSWLTREFAVNLLADRLEGLVLRDSRITRVVPGEKPEPQTQTLQTFELRAGDQVTWNGVRVRVERVFSDATTPEGVLQVRGRTDQGYVGGMAVETATWEVTR